MGSPDSQHLTRGEVQAAEAAIINLSCCVPQAPLEKRPLAVRVQRRVPESVRVAVGWILCSSHGNRFLLRLIQRVFTPLIWEEGRTARRASATRLTLVWVKSDLRLAIEMGMFVVERVEQVMQTVMER